MNSSPLRWLVPAALLLVVLIVSTSAYIRLSQDGLGCAGWPDCYGRDVRLPAAGQLLPEPSDLFWARALHRFTASLVSVLLVMIALFGWKDARGTRGAALALLALAGFLGILGVATPSTLPAVTIANLLGGMSMVALLWWLYRGRHEGPVPAGGGALAWLVIAALVLEIALGGMMSARHAALACVTLPACTGGWLPEVADWRVFNPFFGIGTAASAGYELQAVAMAHRAGAVLVAALVVALAVAMLRRSQETARYGWIMLGLVGVQLPLGAVMVFASLPLPLALAHNLCAALLFAAAAGLLRAARGAPEKA